MCQIKSELLQFKVGWVFTFAAAAYNLVRMRNLLASPVGAA